MYLIGVLYEEFIIRQEYQMRSRNSTDAQQNTSI